MLVEKTTSHPQLQFSDSVLCLKQFEPLLEKHRISGRKKAALYEQLYFFLQHLTIHTDFSARNCSPVAVAAFLEPATGFSVYDLRVELLHLLFEVFENPALLVPVQPGRAWLRTLRELVFWRGYQRRVAARTRVFFEGITQEQILEAEKACLPFYEAVNSVSPERDFTGVFLDSDQEILRRLQMLAGEREIRSMVDLGCGHGRLLQLLGQHFPKAQRVGTSIFEFSEEEKRSLLQHGIQALYCTANRVALPDASQDIVVSSEVIEHLRNPEDMISEIHRMLKPGGIFCVTAPAKSAAFFNRNPFSYFSVFLDGLVPGILPPFHNLYAPLTPIPIVHYGFDFRDFQERFQKYFPECRTNTIRYTPLKKFRLDGIAAHVPGLKNMGGLCIVFGKKTR